MTSLAKSILPSYLADSSRLENVARISHQHKTNLCNLHGEGTDLVHYYLLQTMQYMLQTEISRQGNIFGPMFIEHVEKKFSDISKVENLEAQIYYYTQ